MRKVAYKFNNETYKKIINTFCKEEQLIPVEYNLEKHESSPFLFFITDDEEVIKTPPKCEYNCLVSSSQRRGKEYYVINNLFGIVTLRMLLDSIFHGDFLWNVTNAIEYTSNVKELNIGNNCVSQVERLVCKITADLIHFCSFSELEKIRIGFSEMLINAIEHGNLKVTSKEKHEATEKGVYKELLRNRMNHPDFSSKKIHVSVRFNTKLLVIRIEDEGEGFDQSNISPSIDDDKLMRLHGRGIVITKAYYDSVEYNEIGNVVTLRKILP